jgi:CRISPR-associated protein Cas2
MRVILMFDLPSVTSREKREYRKFRKHLIKNGFIMLQESVYSKLALNNSVVERIVNNIRKHKPPQGNLAVLTVTEKQYASMEYILGNKKTDIVDSYERLIII